MPAYQNSTDMTNGGFWPKVARQLIDAICNINEIDMPKETLIK